MSNDIFSSLRSLQQLHGKTHSPSNSNIVWSRFVKVHKTKEEAINYARMDAIRKNKSFTEEHGTDLDSADDAAVESYVDALIERLL